MTTPARAQVPASPSSPRKLRGSSQGRSFSDSGMSLLIVVDARGDRGKRVRKESSVLPQSTDGLTQSRGGAEESRGSLLCASVAVWIPSSSINGAKGRHPSMGPEVKLLEI